MNRCKQDHGVQIQRVRSYPLRVYALTACRQSTSRQVRPRPHAPRMLQQLDLGLQVYLELHLALLSVLGRAIRAIAVWEGVVDPALL